MLIIVPLAHTQLPRALYRKYTAGVIPTHTPDCPHMGAIYTMVLSRVDRLALAVFLDIFHTRSKIVTTGVLRQLPGMQLLVR